MNVISRLEVTGFIIFVCTKHLRNRYLNMVRYSKNYKMIILPYTVRCSLISRIKIMKFVFCTIS